MNFFHARQKAGAIADRRSAIVCLGWTTQRQWVSTLFIFRRFIQSVTPTAKAEITRLPASWVILASHGRSAAKLADTKRSSLHSGRWTISTGFKKKCEDIYPLNFRCENWRDLWAEMNSIVLFRAEHGVRIFRVDNPHTKPVAFWEYLIKGVREKYPDTIFLSEAFT